ncbi:Disease resistance protein RPS2 [Camellia lanceoleosa]|uniref:Disease resistance protein RPS2 n=1 Tax=Camellia lanceoleosa TaxID=1840588 RepID=A0ACC0FPJ7_9ERIC|nr:Disease resistance protein RPS2 [Camellia lanceoleosa]
MDWQVKLTTIEKLEIFQMENLIEIWPGKLQAKLREMTVAKCHELSSILFPSNSIKGMQNLEVLEVKNCRSIAVAFDLEGLVWEDGISDMALPSLKKVELSCLRKLTHVWKDNSPGIQGFQNLRSLVVNKCDCLRNLFSYSLAKLLVKLQNIEVTECGMMESIIGNEPNADDAVITNMIMLPQLSGLKLSDLPNLRSFCSEACTFEGSLLKTIKVINCPKMKILPSAFQRKLEQQKADFSTLSQFHVLDGKKIECCWQSHQSSDLGHCCWPRKKIHKNWNRLAAVAAEQIVMTVCSILQVADEWGQNSWWKPSVNQRIEKRVQVEQVLCIQDCLVVGVHNKHLKAATAKVAVLKRWKRCTLRLKALDERSSSMTIL